MKNKNIYKLLYITFMKNKLLIFSLILFIPFLTNNFRIYPDTYSKTTKKEITENEKFVLNSFKYYNKNIKIETVRKFIEVCDSFELTKNIKTLTAQICLESGAKQTINGEIIESSGNALGICQVTPYTAYLFFKNVISNNDTLLRQLGGTDYKNILNIKDKKLRRIKIQEWLSNETNNLIMYGYLMNHCMKKYGGLKNSLVVYSKGPHFLIKSLESDIVLDTLPYISSIEKIKKSLKTLPN